MLFTTLRHPFIVENGLWQSLNVIFMSAVLLAFAKFNIGLALHCRKLKLHTV